MNQRAITMTIILFILIVVGMFIFTHLKQQELAVEQKVVEDVVVDEVPDPYSYIERINGKHFYIDGVHTVVGEIELPTPCDLLETQAFIAESYPEQITLDYSVINNAEACAQVITTQRFKVSAQASGEAAFDAQFMGRRVILNLIEALPGETPDEFELFIKG